MIDSGSVLTSKLENEMELLERHVSILKAVIDNEPIGIIRLSETTGYPQHKVRYSLRMLEQEMLIAPSAQGAVTSNEVKGFISHLKEMINNMSRTLLELESILQ
ncbi:MAG: hypothetical protein CVT48_00065 [Thermoplasmata archaeon HGW-Thermoplasmata-1]|nr:MAG: hypothetical protein CVT48_00065 [Thermoplasmata archaeon HGW-Thermoplasmata-1]